MQLDPTLRSKGTKTSPCNYVLKNKVQPFTHPLDSGLSEAALCHHAPFKIKLIRGEAALCRKEGQDEVMKSRLTTTRAYTIAS